MAPDVQTAQTHPRIRSVEIFNEHRPAAQTVVIIPTYDERENIEAILLALNGVEAEFDVLVADDGSPDGTADAVAAIAPRLPRRILLMRRGGKYGLGVAYLDALHWLATNRPEYRNIVQMDADFSHDPNMIPSLVREADAHGMAVGSRYVEGGAAPDWSRQRLMLSLAANTYLRTVLRLFFPSYPVRDNTSGFIAWRRDALEAVLVRPILGDGYSFLSSLKLVSFLAGFPAKEIPIVLHDRRIGVSKLNRGILLEATLMPWKMGWRFRFGSGRRPVRSDHDNRPEMWDRYYASEDETGWFAKLVHFAREGYFGGLFARRVVRLGGKADSYLELGVGTAQSLARLQKMTGARCAGIEITPRAYEIGKAYATNCEMILGDGMHMPFADASYDVVYSLGLLEHFSPEDQARLLREQARVARNAVLVEVPTRAPHMRAILWFNRKVLKKRGVWADEELFSASHFRAKYPGMPFTYFFDWASGCLTCWFVLKPDDIRTFVPLP